MAKIACLSPMYFGDESYVGGGERYPLNLARGVVASTGGEFAVDLISFGPAARSYPIEPGLTMRVLPAARPPLNPLDVVSWDLPSAIADADLVHIHQAYTRCSEVALLVAKQQGKAIVVTDHGGTTSTLGTSVGALELADRIVANSEFGAGLYRTTRPITVIKGGVDGAHFRPDPAGPPRDRVLYVGADPAAQGDRPARRGAPGRPPADDLRPGVPSGLPRGAEGPRGRQAGRVRARGHRRRHPGALPAGLGQRPAVGLPRLLRRHPPRPRADGVHPPRGDGVRDAGDLLGRRRDAGIRDRRRDRVRLRRRRDARRPPPPTGSTTRRSSSAWAGRPGIASRSSTTTASPGPASPRSTAT